MLVQKIVAVGASSAMVCLFFGVAAPPAAGQGAPAMIESDAAKHAVRCSPPGTEECVQKCEAIQAYCAHRAKHPYSPSSGIGDLYYCESDRGDWQCRYVYENGDTCTLQQPIHKWKCKYTTPNGGPE